jgi:hypothetical protein
MIRILARWWAKRKYVWKEELDAALKDLNASAAQAQAGKRRKEVERLTAEADGIEASIKEVGEKMAKGFWLCEDGHERADQCSCARTGDVAIVHSGGCQLNPKNGFVYCTTDGKPMKLVRTDLMTGQEKYESEKERKEAEKMADANRQAVKQHEEAIKGSEDTATVFRKQAQQAREFAELLTKL